jgi:hypothetical protein
LGIFSVRQNNRSNQPGLEKNKPFCIRRKSAFFSKGQNPGQKTENLKEVQYENDAKGIGGGAGGVCGFGCARFGVHV